ncbi:MAG: hypothetical protein U0R80_10110 [Nocardioidaceae bacterium]
MTVLAAELSDLTGWSQQVGRAGTDCQGLSDYLSAHVTDGEFGMILELITMDYERLIPVFTEALATDGTRLQATGRSIESIVRDYAATDARVAQDFGEGKAITDDGLIGTGFYDLSTVLPVPGPSSNAASLPQVSFGFIFDKICDLTHWIIGIDPRDYVTRWIAGDIEKASRQASAWQHVSDCLDGVDKNVARGQTAINATWQGEAATASAAYVDQWLASLGEQSRSTATISSHLHDMIRSAVDLAQNVVDIIRMIISICSAALSSSYIPLWGQWKAVQTIKEAWELFKTARKAIQAFWQIITTIKNLLVSIAHAVTADGLPAAPVVPAAR